VRILEHFVKANFLTTSLLKFFAKVVRVFVFNMQVAFETSIGTFTVELYTQHAPLACTNLYELAKIGYYDNTSFHRIIKDFMIQGGDPTATGKGGESIYGGMFTDEITPELRHVGAGVLSCANSGPNTNGSQFFITLAPCSWLDGKHTIFGRVCKGMGVIRKMGSVATGDGDRPLQSVDIIKATALPLPSA
jgi:peptidyl-prolyl cis-trans isomerase-like 1